MDIHRHFRAAVVAAVTDLADRGDLPAGLATDAITVAPPRDPGHGDLATNAALVLAKPAGAKPRDIAERLAAVLARVEGVAGVEVAGPGFVNLRLTDGVWRQVLAAILAAGEDYGASAIGQGRAVNVEYVSANPTGPLHVGHARGAVYGDALSALLEKAGFAVTREYYINDAGAQIDQLARSLHWRYLEAQGAVTGAMPDGLYPGDYLAPVGAEIAAAEGGRWRDAPEGDWLAPFRDRAVAAMMALIREDLAALGVRHDVFFSEASLHRSGRVQEVLDELSARDLIYTGVLQPPKGKQPDDWEPRPQLLFRATQFGDDTDRPLKKSDGSWTYFASDIAYHLDKFKRGAATLIDVLGADHGGYVKRMKAATRAVTGGQGELDVKICQLVALREAGRPVKMSKRAGTFVTLRDMVDRVGRDVVRFIMLTRKNDAPLEFDFVKVAEQSRDNPVFYVQYAHARIRSVFRNARRDMAGLAIGPAALASADLDRVADPAELSLIRHLAEWPRIVETAALAHEPHRVAFHLYDLAAEFHGLWNKGKDADHLRFLVAGDGELTRARLALLQGTATVLASGLAIMGVEPVEEMR